MSTTTAQHWNRAFTGAAEEDHSWYEREPVTSLRLLREADPARGSVIDVGAGTSTLVEALLADGWAAVTVLDVSDVALATVRARLGHLADRVRFVVGDVLAWEPDTSYDVWHDRAAFHFLTSPDEQRRYVAGAARAVRADGSLVIGTFAGDGPTRCSGLPAARYTAAALAATFGPRFRAVHSEREEHSTPAGAVQPFTWLVLRRNP
jgi:SAM-dependent methyltransferase